MSENAPPVQIIGAAPKKPHQNLVMIMATISLEAPVAKEKSAEMKHGATVGHFRPYISDRGAHTNGPKPNLEYYVSDCGIMLSMLTYPRSRTLVPRTAILSGTPY